MAMPLILQIKLKKMVVFQCCIKLYLLGHSWCSFWGAIKGQVSRQSFISHNLWKSSSANSMHTLYYYLPCQKIFVYDRFPFFYLNCESSSSGKKNAVVCAEGIEFQGDDFIVREIRKLLAKRITQIKSHMKSAGKYLFFTFGDFLFNYQIGPISICRG